MIVALIVLGVLVVGGLTGLLVWTATARPSALDDQTLSEPTSSAAHVPLPAAMTPQSVDGLRFDITLRGYRMQQVDAVLDRLRDELAEREAEISRLQVDLDVARSTSGDPQLGHGPIVRSSGEDSMWSSGGIRSYQAGDRPAAGGRGSHSARASRAHRPVTDDGTDGHH